jgi:hypothetical protein
VHGTARCCRAAAAAGLVGGKERKTGSRPRGQNGLADWATRGRKEAGENWAARRVSAQEAGKEKEFGFPFFGLIFK